MKQITSENATEKIIEWAAKIKDYDEQLFNGNFEVTNIEPVEYLKISLKYNLQSRRFIPECCKPFEGEEDHESYELKDIWEYDLTKIKNTDNYYRLDETSQKRICPNCSDGKSLVCSKCKGSGKIRSESYSYSKGRNVIETSVCRNCNGSGRVICETCNGLGKVAQFVYIGLENNSEELIELFKKENDVFQSIESSRQSDYSWLDKMDIEHSFSSNMKKEKIENVLEDCELINNNQTLKDKVISIVKKTRKNTSKNHFQEGTLDLISYSFHKVTFAFENTTYSLAISDNGIHFFADGANKLKKYFKDQKKDSKQSCENKNIIEKTSLSIEEVYPPKSRTTALLLCLFFGFFGVHRFYAGRIMSGILLIVLNCLLIGMIFTFVDFIKIITGHFKDSHERCITEW